MIYDFFASALNPRRNKKAKRRTNRDTRRLRFESLETRRVLSVSLADPHDIFVPGGKSALVPLTGIDSGGGPINYTFQSSDAAVTLALVSPASQSLVLNVSGTDGNSQAFTGTLTLKLFEDLAPGTTARIEQLVSSGFYNGLPFTRVFDGFVMQGGDNGVGGTGQLLDDEFSTSLTYNSPGLLAMARQTPNDTADAQFFITALSPAGSDDPVTIAQMPQFLNFRYTIFGQLVDGFETYEKIMSTEVAFNPALNENSTPVNPITINSAQLVNDTQNAVLRVFAPTGFNGNTATITVTATNSLNETAQQQFTASAALDTHADPPFLGPTPNLTTALGSPISFTLTSTDLEGAGVSYVIVDPTTFNDPQNVTGSFDEITGQATLVPTPGFTGTIQILAGVRAANAANNLENFDTQLFTLTVTSGPTLNSVAPQETTTGAPVSFTLTSTNQPAEGVFYVVVDANTLAPPDNVTVEINQATGQVTLTPAPGLVSGINLLAGVRAANATNDFANFDTLPFSLTIDAGPTLDPVANQITTLGTPVAFTLTSDDPNSAGTFYSVVDATTLGAPTLVIVNVNQASGQVTLVPVPGVTGTFNLLARVRGASAVEDPANYHTQSFTLTVNPGPMLDEVNDQSTTLGTPIVFTLTSNDPSLEGVFYKIVDPVTFAAPANVTIDINQQTGEVTLTPTTGFTGPISLLAAVRGANSIDVQADYDTQSFTLTLIPELSEVSNQTTTLGVPVMFTLTSTDPAGAGLDFQIVDPTTLAAPANVTISIIDASGQVTLTPNAGFVGTVNLLARVRGANSEDVPGNYDTQSFTFTVNPGPVLSAVDDKTTTLGTPLVFTLIATNPAAGDLDYQIVDANTLLAPANVTVNVNDATGQVTITPNPGFTSGPINLLARVRGANSIDDPANYSTDAFTLTVNAGPDLGAVSNQTTAFNTAVSFTLTSTGPSGVFSVVDPTTMAAPANVTVNINQATGLVTLTPNTGFAGTVNLLARVRGTDAQDAAGNYDTQAFSLKVNSVPTLADPLDIQVPVGKAVLVPLTGTDAAGQPLTYTFGSSNPNVQLSLVSQASRTLKLTVTGKDGAGNNFTGTLMLRLFEDIAPVTTARIIQLVQQGFYNNKEFFRVNDGFVIQNDGSTGQQLDEEFNALMTFNSPGLLSMAHTAIHDTADAQFFITALSPAGSDNPITLAQMPQFLNFRFAVFGQLVSGFDTYEKIMSTPVTFNPSLNENSSPITDVIITSAEIVTDTQNAVLMVRSPAGFTGNATITVTATNTDGEDVQQQFAATQVADTQVDPPFLGSVTNQTTTAGNAVTFTLTSTNLETTSVAYKVGNPSDLGAPANVTVSINQATGQVTLTPAAGFTGTISLRAGVRSSATADQFANYDTEDFTLTVNPVSQEPMLGAVGNKTTTVATPITFTLTSTNPTGAPIVYKVGDPSFGTPANVTVNVNQTTGQVTLTPAAGFTGTINLLAGVRRASSDDVLASYDTEAFTLTVSNQPAAPTGLVVDATSNTGPFDGNGYVTTATPRLRVTAPTGSTVQFKLNGVVIATGTETAAGSGQFTANVPAGRLGVGNNSITAVVTSGGVTSTDSTPLVVIYAPSYASGVYVVPGTPGTAQTLTMGWNAKNAAYSNEFGYFIVNSTDGSIGTLSPDDDGYAQAALSSSTRKIIFARGEKAGATENIALQAGQLVVFYMIQNNTTGNFLAKNPSNTFRGNNNGDAPLAFFSVAAANPDGQKHAQIIADPTTGRVQYNWEDLFNRGDSDFNDGVINVRLAGQSAKHATLRAPGAGNTVVRLTGELKPGKIATPRGDVGVFFVNNPDGAIGNLNPGDAGYTAAALAAGNFQVLFNAGEDGTQVITVPAGRYLAFFAIVGGTVQEALLPSSSATPLFSFDEANPSETNHFRWYSPGQQAADPDVVQLHIMDRVNGSESDFDSFVIDLRFTS